METIEKGRVAKVPVDLLIREKKSQRDRRINEIMGHLFAGLPDKPGSAEPDFVLADGTECRIVKFSQPKERDGEIRYGFDVKLNEGPLDHIEFLVKCTGYGGAV